MAAAITERTRLIFVCNPNNPTGTIVTRAELVAFLDQVPADVLVVSGRGLLRVRPRSGGG